MHCRNGELFFVQNILSFDQIKIEIREQLRINALISQTLVSFRIMSVIQQLKDAGGITAIETLLNESLIQTAPARIVLSSVGVGVFLSYIYSQLTHKVNII